MYEEMIDKFVRLELFGCAELSCRPTNGIVEGILHCIDPDSGVHVVLEPTGPHETIHFINRECISTLQVLRAVETKESNDPNFDVLVRELNEVQIDYELERGSKVIKIAGQTVIDPPYNSETCVHGPNEILVRNVKKIVLNAFRNK
ncbi:hypothetical protein ACOME3_006361 [Neoechinorhynchus agilis]